MKMLLTAFISIMISLLQQRGQKTFPINVYLNLSFKYSRIMIPSLKTLTKCFFKNISIMIKSVKTWPRAVKSPRQGPGILPFC